MSHLPFASSVRNLNRLQQIVRVLARHGFGHVVERLNLGRYLPLGKLLGATRKDQAGTEPVSLGQRLAAVCAELGPTFVKLAQMLSTRPDLLPEAVTGELAKLQDQVPPFDHGEAMAIVAAEIGQPVAEAFASFAAEPFACGSIGQVYHARSQDNEDLVVKVKRPGIDDIVQQDLHLLQWLAEAAEKWVPELARLRPTKIVDEFEMLLTNELDLISEASATARFAEGLGSESYVDIPQVEWSLTGRRVLTLQRLRGSSLDQVVAGAAGPMDRHLLARRVVHIYLKQFFDMRLFHADPHPGNIIFGVPARLGLIDFGQVGLISEEMANQLVTIVVAMIYREPHIVVDVLSDLGAIGEATDEQALARALRQLLDKYHGLPLKRLDVSTLFSELATVMRSYDVTLPREIVLVLKTLTAIGGVALQLDPELDLVQIIRPRLNQLIANRFAPQNVARSVGVSLWHIMNILKSAPAQLRSVLRLVSRGRWQTHIRHENIDRLTDEIDRSSNRMSFAIVIAAIIVGSSQVISSAGEFSLGGIPIQWVGVAGYLFAGILGVGLLWAILRSGRLS